MKNKIIIYLQKIGLIKPRSVRSLLLVLLNNPYLFRDGLCQWVDSLYHYKFITTKEWFILKKYLRENAPKNYLIYWFEPGKIEPRIKWIDKQLGKL